MNDGARQGIRLICIHMNMQARKCTVLLQDNNKECTVDIPAFMRCMVLGLTCSYALIDRSVKACVIDFPLFTVAGLLTVSVRIDQKCSFEIDLRIVFLLVHLPILHQQRDLQTLLLHRPLAASLV